MMKLEPELIDMSDYEESGDGFCAISYNHRNGKTMIKLYNDFVDRSVSDDEIRESQAVLDMGITTPRPIRMVTDGKHFGNEYERILNKRSFARAISQEPDKVEYYAVEFAKMCKQLHSTPCDKDIFPSAADYARKNIKENTYLTDERKKKVLDFIDRVPETETCVHGDLHIGNIITDGKKNYWIDLSEFSYGNPLFDLGMWYIVSNANPDDITMKLYHVNNATMANVWKLFVREYFGAISSDEIEEINKRLVPYAIMRMIFFINQTKQVFPPVRQFIEENFHYFIDNKM